jgi:hypothetical protein
MKIFRSALLLLSVAAPAMAFTTQVYFEPTQYSVNEAAGSVTIHVKRSGDTTGSTTYYLTAGDSSAVHGQDYGTDVSTHGFTFAPGETTKDYTIPIIQDSLSEYDEVFGVSLASPEAQVLAGNAAITIVDDDPHSYFSLEQLQRTVTEHDGSITFNVNRTGDMYNSPTVHWSTNGTRGTSVVAPASGTLTFAPNETVKSVTLPIVNDDVYTPGEEFVFGIDNPTGGQIRNGSEIGSTRVFITEDDPPPLFGFSPTTYSVNEGAGQVTLTVTRTGNMNGTYEVRYETFGHCTTDRNGVESCPNSGASAGNDFAPIIGSLVFAPNETTKTFFVSIIDDSIAEGNEFFHVDIQPSQPQFVRAGGGRADVTIVDNEAVPTVTFAPAAYSVREDAHSVTVTLTRSSPTGAIAVGYHTVDGTAHAGTDYTAASGTLNFADGEASKTISIPVLDNDRYENSRAFTVSVTNGANATNHADVTITDDEVLTTMHFAQTSLSVNENAGTLPITIIREGATNRESRIYASAFDMTATAANDYFFPIGTVVFAPGETSKTINATIRDDSVAESDETFRVTLTLNNDDGSPFNPAPLIVTIHDDDNPGPSSASLSINDVSVIEGNSGTTNATFTVTLSAPLTTTASVHYETSDGSAKDGSDYNFTSGTLTFAPGQTSRTISVPVVGDTLVENDEIFFVQLSGASGARITGGPGHGTILNDDYAVNTIRGVAFASPGNTSLSLDLYLPMPTVGYAGGIATDDMPTKLLPAIVWIHGDHWADGSRESSPAAREALRGYVVASIDYRFSNTATYPAQINDAKAAVRWVRANAAQYNIDPERIAVWGFGSGGHLAALLGTAGNGTLDDPSLGNGGYASNVQAVVSWAAPYDLARLNADAASCSTVDHASRIRPRTSRATIRRSS